MTRSFTDPYPIGTEVFAFFAPTGQGVELQRAKYLGRKGNRFRFSDDAGEWSENGEGRYDSSPLVALGKFIDAMIPSAFMRREKLDEGKLAKRVVEAVNLYQAIDRREIHRERLATAADAAQRIADSLRSVLMQVPLGTPTGLQTAPPSGTQTGADVS